MSFIKGDEERDKIRQETCEMVMMSSKGSRWVKRRYGGSWYLQSVDKIRVRNLVRSTQQEVETRATDLGTRLLPLSPQN